MNAILRHECEVTVLSHEAIEVHLSYLRPAVEALGEKLDQANKDRAAGDAMLADKIDQANKDRAAGDAMLAERLMKVQASQDGLKWFVSSLTILATGVSIAHSLGWI